MRDNRVWLWMGLIIFCAATTGCVERELSISTDPPGSVVFLNDEEIGQSPVTVNFNWYGDYRVRIAKDGYETLTTTKELERPWTDWFPFDLVAQAWPKQFVNSYEWHFRLEERQETDRQVLLERASDLAEQAGSVEQH